MVVCELMVDRGKADEDRQDAGSQRNDDGDDSESKEAVQGPWKSVPAATAVPSPPAKPAPVPEPGTCDILNEHIELSFMSAVERTLLVLAVSRTSFYSNLAISPLHVLHFTAPTAAANALVFCPSCVALVTSKD